MFCKSWDNLNYKSFFMLPSSSTAAKRRSVSYLVFCERVCSTGSCLTGTGCAFGAMGSSLGRAISILGASALGGMGAGVSILGATGIGVSALG